MEPLDRLILVFKAFVLIFIVRFLLKKIAPKNNNLAHIENQEQNHLLTNYNKIMNEQIELFLRNAELSYRIVESTERKTIFRLGFALDTGNYDVLIFNFHESQLLIVKIFSNSNIPDIKKAFASEYFMRLNDNLKHGNFELNFSNGSYSFKTSNYYSDNSTDLEINLDRNLKACCKEMDDCHHELMNVIYSNISPEQAFNNLMQIPNPILN